MLPLLGAMRNAGGVDPAMPQELGLLPLLGAMRNLQGRPSPERRDRVAAPLRGDEERYTSPSWSITAVCCCPS